MDLIEIKVPLPTVVEEVYEKMEQLAQGRYFCLGGGAISNAYMGIPIRDVDVFYNFELSVEQAEEIFGTKIEMVYSRESHYEDDDVKIPYLCKLQYKGMEVELIMTPPFRVTEFDLRFRQFYLYKKKIYASKEALEDIEKKELIVVNPSTPISTYFRLHRFKEQLGFTIPKKSMDYVLWSFNEKGVEKKRAIEYVEKREEKISPQLKKELLAFYETNYKEEYIYIKSAVFPYHPAIEQVVATELRRYEGTLAIHHEVLEKYNGPLERTFDLEIPYKYYATKMETFIDRLKKFRLRYVFMPSQAKQPFPVTTKKEDFKDYLNHTLLHEISRGFEHEELPNEWNHSQLYMLRGIKPLKEVVRVNLVSGAARGYYYTYGDILYNHVLFLEVEIEGKAKESMKFVLRKCDNGKYTIADLETMEADGAGFYIDIIGKAMKEQYGAFFDFENEQLNGLFAFSYYEGKPDYYFRTPSYRPNFLDQKQHVYYSPIKLPISASM